MGLLVDTKLNMASNTSLHLCCHQQPPQAHTSTSQALGVASSSYLFWLKEGSWSRTKFPSTDRGAVLRAEAPAEEKFLPPCSSVLHFHLSPVQGVEKVTVAALVTSSESLVAKCLSGKPSESLIPKSLPPLSKPRCGWRWAPAYKLEPRLGLGKDSAMRPGHKSKFWFGI